MFRCCEGVVQSFSLSNSRRQSAGSSQARSHQALKTRPVSNSRTRTGIFQARRGFELLTLKLHILTTCQLVFINVKAVLAPLSTLRNLFIQSCAGSSFCPDADAHRCTSSSFCPDGPAHRCTGSSFCPDGPAHRCTGSSFRLDGPVTGWSFGPEWKPDPIHGGTM